MSAHLERITFHAVGTTCSAAVTAGRHDTRRARRALSAARAEVAACEEVLSRFLPTSDLSRLNASAGEWTAVDERLLEVLRLALRAREETAGRFDPTILPALVAAGYDRSFEQLVERPARPVPTTGAQARRSSSTRGRSRAPRAGRRRRPEAIGKGYAAERALWTPCATPGRRFPAVSSTWAATSRCGERHPRADPGGSRSPTRADRERGIGVLLLNSGGVATSGRDVRRFGPGRSLHHLIDPATGEPAAPGPLAVTVVAPDGSRGRGPRDRPRDLDGRRRRRAYRPARADLRRLRPAGRRADPARRPPLVQSRLLVRAA